MNTFHLEIVVPDKAFYSDEVQEIVLKTPGGEIGILKGHIPMVVAVSIGLIKIKKEERWIYASVSEGFMEVTADRTIVLADSAEWPEEIDVERARSAEERARAQLSARQGDTEDANLQAALQRSLCRQKVSEKTNH